MIHRKLACYYLKLFRNVLQSRILSDKLFFMSLEAILVTITRAGLKRSRACCETAQLEQGLTEYKEAGRGRVFDILRVQG